MPNAVPCSTELQMAAVVAFRQPGASSGTVTPSRIGVNSLSAITAEHGAEDQEEELWGQIRDWKGDDVSLLWQMQCKLRHALKMSC